MAAETSRSEVRDRDFRHRLGRPRTRSVFVLLLLLTFSACAGGGGSTSSTPTSATGLAASSTATGSSATGSTTTSTSATTSSPSIAPSGPLRLPITDAAAFRDRLVQLGSAGLGRFDSAFGAFQLEQVWKGEFPTLNYAGGGAAADPTTVSVEGALVSTSGTDDTVITFAVKDSQGRCAGGTGVAPHGATRAPQRFQTVTGPFSACTADAVADRYHP